MAKVFTHPERQKAFEQALVELRRALPNATADALRKMAQGKARNVPVAKKAKKPSTPVNVAQTYRPPTRAERNEQHRAKMAEKARWRNKGPLGIKPLANLSRNHPDYGMTPAEHARAKARRNA